MIPRRRVERTQKGNPHKLTREQHIIPAATLRRFAQSDGKVEVRFRDGRIVRLPVKDKLFCVDRLWDQRSEAGYMKKIEDEFQGLVDELDAGRSGPLSSDEHKCVTRFWGLWHWRNHFIDSPLEDTSLNGIAGESPLTVDQKEILESRFYVFVDKGKLSARIMTGIHINAAILAINRSEMANGGKHWGLLRSPSVPLIIGDRPGNLMTVPASPRILLAADYPDGELTQAEVFKANQSALAFSRNFAVIGRFHSQSPVEPSRS